ncbi:MAG: hypothetical protein KIT56_03610 [Gammaproteobacteria bacterium]|nr:hypothetical protein [Gammaproteobacteria bacterium]MCW5582964.1 hypothetical protein [Gammaproteobacteria bacterium]
MQRVFVRLTLLMGMIGLAGCSSLPSIPGFGSTENVRHESKGLIGKSVDKTGKETNVNITMSGGGDIGVQSMDANDKAKMSRALDAAPGKATRWENGSSGITYTVTPIKKIVIRGNPFCREYEVEVTKGNYKKVIRDTACVTSDGSWHTV